MRSVLVGLLDCPQVSSRTKIRDPAFTRCISAGHGLFTPLVVPSHVAVEIPGETSADISIELET